MQTEFEKYQCYLFYFYGGVGGVEREPRNE